MNDLKIFENKEFGKIRTVIENGETWFIGKEVADMDAKHEDKRRRERTVVFCIDSRRF